MHCPGSHPSERAFRFALRAVAFPFSLVTLVESPVALDFFAPDLPVASRPAAFFSKFAMPDPGKQDHGPRGRRAAELAG